MKAERSKLERGRVTESIIGGLNGPGLIFGTNLVPLSSRRTVRSIVLPGTIAKDTGREPFSFAIKAFLTVEYSRALAKITSKVLCARTLATATFASNFRSSRC